VSRKSFDNLPFWWGAIIGVGLAVAILIGIARLVLPLLEPPWHWIVLPIVGVLALWAVVTVFTISTAVGLGRDMNRRRPGGRPAWGHSVLGLMVALLGFVIVAIGHFIQAGVVIRFTLPIFAVGCLLGLASLRFNAWKYRSPAGVLAVVAILANLAMSVWAYLP
jgi:hypothetical protein